MLVSREYVKGLLRDPADEAWKSGVAQLKDDKKKRRVTLGSDGNTKVVLEASMDAYTKRLTKELVSAQMDEGRVLAIVKTRDQASALNRVAVTELIKRQEGGGRFAVIADNVFARGMPIVLARGDVSGITHGQIYRVEAVGKNSIFVKTDAGTNIELNADQVEDHIDAAFVVTSSRAHFLKNPPTKIVAFGAGLDEHDLEWIEAQNIPTELVVLDADTATERDYLQLGRARVLELIKRDADRSDKSRSATYLLDRDSGKELGLEALQMEVKVTTAAINAVQNETPRNVARNDIEHDIIEQRRILADLTGRVETAADDVEREDAARGVEQVVARLAGLAQRSAIVSSELPDEDAAIVAELERSDERHANDEARLVELHEKLQRYSRIRITAAIKNPQPYHNSIPINPDLSVAEQQASKMVKLAIIEEYRTKWNITDTTSGLGPIPAGGVQLREWTEANWELGYDDQEAARRR
jgi:hypothetical protein